MIETITIIGGRDKYGIKELYDELSLSASETVSIVGQTGSGKTALINDIEQLAQGDTATGRRILLNGEKPKDDIRFSAKLKPITIISQNTKCFTDLKVEDFLEIHSKARGHANSNVARETLELANFFTGESIGNKDNITTLSGGQTRALLIADAILIGNSPIVLLDEIENAGIYKQRVVDKIKDYNKMVIFVTHDPAIALRTDRRIIMENGGIKKVLDREENESRVAEFLLEIDTKLTDLREDIRLGNRISEDMFKNLAWTN